MPADPMLDRKFDELRRVELPRSLPQTLEWMAETERQRGRARRPRAATVARLLAYAGAHRLQLASAFGVVIVLACQTPVETSTTFGYLVSGRMGLPPAAARTELMALPWIESETLQVLGIVTARIGDTEEVVGYVGSGEAVLNGERITTPTSRFVAVLSARDGDQVEEWRRALESRGASSLRVDPMEHTVRQPAYRAVLQSFSYEFESELPPEAVRERVARHLEALELNQVRVETRTRSDGTVSVRLTARPAAGEAGHRQTEAVQELLQDVGPAVAPSGPTRR